MKELNRNSRKKGEDSKSVFVSFEFKTAINEVIEMFIKEAVEDLGLKPNFVNHQNITQEEVMHQIDSSHMVITDLSHNKTNRHFEAEYAKQKDIPLILTCLEGRDFVYDEGISSHLSWSDGEELRAKVIERIKEVA